MSEGAHIGATSNANGFDTWNALQLITQETRADIITDIVGHPKGMPSMTELDYLNYDVDRSTITGHLNKLIDAGVIGVAEFPPGERPGRGKPYKFYYITDDARELFDKNNIFDSAIWRDVYVQVEQPDEIKDVEAITRPHVR